MNHSSNNQQSNFDFTDEELINAPKKHFVEKASSSNVLTQCRDIKQSQAEDLGSSGSDFGEKENAGPKSLWDFIDDTGPTIRSTKGFYTESGTQRLQRFHPEVRNC